MLEQEVVYNDNVQVVTSEAVGFRGSELYEITSGHICNTYAGYGPSHFFMRKDEMAEIEQTANPDSFEQMLAQMKQEEAGDPDREQAGDDVPGPWAGGAYPPGFRHDAGKKVRFAFGPAQW